MLNREKNVGDDFVSWPRAKVAFAVHANADRAGLQVARADDQHGVDFHLLGVLDFAVNLVTGIVGLARTCRARSSSRMPDAIVDEPVLVADGQHAHLLRREPEREVAGVMFDQKADEPLVRAERRAMDAERRLLRVVAGPCRPGRSVSGTAKSTWLVARVNSRPITLQTCTSIFGP